MPFADLRYKAKEDVRIKLIVEVDFSSRRW